MEGRTDDRMSPFVGISKPAGGPIAGGIGAVKGKAGLSLIPLLGLHFGKIQRFAGDPGGGPCLESAKGQAKAAQVFGQGVCRHHAVGA